MAKDWFRSCDWRKTGDYPDPKNTSAHRWAWEFLRRNEEFARGFKEWMDAVKEHPRRGGKFRPGEHPADKERQRLNDRWHIKTWALNAERAAHWDSPCLFATGMADHIWHSVQFKGDDRWFHVVEERRSQFLYRVNLNWPISPQIEAIKRHARHNQAAWEQNRRPNPQANKRMHVTKFPIYLRAFDAAACGANANEVADQWASEKIRADNRDYAKLFENALAAARRFINDGEYIFIPMSESHKRPK